MFCGIFIAEEVNGAGDKGSGDTTKADVKTLLEAVLDIFLAFACLVKLLSSKKRNFQSWDHSPQVSAYQDFHTLERQTKEMLPVLMITETTNKFLNSMKTRDKIIFGPYPEPVMKTKFFRTYPLSIINGSNYAEIWPLAL